MFKSVSKMSVDVIGLVAQWITRLTTDQKIPGSNPGKLVKFLFNEIVSDYGRLLIRQYREKLITW